MKKGRGRKEADEFPDLELTAGSLMGRQSVRTTFRLPEQVISLLSIVSNQLGLKQKSLFDQLVENRSILYQVAGEAQSYRPVTSVRRAKTFVISKNSLDALDDVARDHQMPRDILVEISINRLLPVISAEQEKQKKRKLILKDMEAYLLQGKKLLAKAGKSLGREDPIVKGMYSIVSLCDRSVAQLESLIEKGKCLDQL